MRIMRRRQGRFPAPAGAFSNNSMNDVSKILQRIESGDRQAAEELLPIVYDHLRSLASRRLAHEPPGQTLQTTELVHDAYLRLVGSEQSWQGTSHFFAAAAEAMRRILVERARKKKRIRHGGDRQRIELHDATDRKGPSVEEVLLVNDLLDRFAAEHPAEAELVKLHYFAGLNISEAGRVLGISSSTAHRHWTFARAWLREAGNS